MRKTTVVISFALVMCGLRLADSILTRRLVEVHGDGVKELNPLVSTDSVSSVFFSPVPVAVSLVFFTMFFLMVLLPGRTLAAYRDPGDSVASISVKIVLGMPFLIIAFMLLAVMQNSSILFIGASMWPEVVREWKVANPVLALFFLMMTLELVFGPLFRKAMVALLSRVEPGKSTHFD